MNSNTQFNYTSKKIKILLHKILDIIKHKYLKQYFLNKNCCLCYQSLTYSDRPESRSVSPWQAALQSITGHRSRRSRILLHQVSHLFSSCPQHAWILFLSLTLRYKTFSQCITSKYIHTHKQPLNYSVWMWSGWRWSISMEKSN